MRLVLVDPVPEMAVAWTRWFTDPDVVVRTGGFGDLHEPFDCLVTAGNSFGLMDGGVDLAVRDHYPGVEAAVQQRILGDHHGELNVGDAIVVRAPDGPLVAYAPTMRVPGDIRGTDNVYRAMRAWLVALHREVDTPVATVACPGLGTGYGWVPPDEAARQMALAWRNWHHPPAQLTWNHAAERTRELEDGMYLR